MENEGREGMEGMEGKVQAVLDALADLRGKANVNAVFGAPVTVGGRTVIPVASVAYGFRVRARHETATTGGAAAETTAETAEKAGSQGVGGFGRLRAYPLAIVEVTAEETHIEPITNVNKPTVVLAGVLLAGWVVFWLAWALIKIFGRRG